MSIKYYLFKVDLVWKNLPQDKQSQYKSIKKVASISYGKESNKSPEEFVKMIIKKGHYSVLEHTDITMKVGLKHFFEFPEHIFRNNPYIHIESYYEWQTFYPEYYIIRTNLRALLEKIEKSKHISNEVLTNIWLFIQGYYPELFNLELADCQFSWEYPMDIRFLDNNEYTNTNLDRFCFYIECSRDISMQLLRHRSLSFNQESQRYVDYSKELPICFLNGVMVDAVEAYEMCHKTYCHLLNCDKFKKEKARGVLPGDTRTRLYVTGYRKDFEHFIELRDSKHAQPEIRWVAQQIKEKINE